MGASALISFGLSLAIAGLISFLIARSRKDDRSFSVPIFVIATIVVHGMLAPVALRWQAERQLEHYAFYKQIAKADPSTFERIKGVVLDGVRENRSEAETSAQIAAILGQALPRRVSHASDETALAFAGEMNQLLAQMSRTNPDACFYLLHPEKSGSGSVPNVDLGIQNAQEQLLNSMAQMLESATSHPQPEPDADRSQRLIQTIFASMNQKYGKDMALMRSAANNSWERKEACEMSSEMFREITDLPATDASMVIRYMFSEAGRPLRQVEK